MLYIVAAGVVSADTEHDSCSLSFCEGVWKGCLRHLLDTHWLLCEVCYIVPFLSYTTFRPHEYNRHAQVRVLHALAAISQSALALREHSLAAADWAAHASIEGCDNQQVHCKLCYILS